MKKNKNEDTNKSILKELKKANKELHDIRIILLYWGFYGGLLNTEPLLDEHKVKVPVEFSLKEWEKINNELEESWAEIRKPLFVKFKEKISKSNKP